MKGRISILFAIAMLMGSLMSITNIAYGRDPLPGSDLTPISALALSVTDLAHNPSRTGFPHPLNSDPGWGGGADTWDILDGNWYYPNWTEGLAFNFGGTRQLTIDFGQTVTFDEVVIWHHTAQSGEGIPASVALEYYDGAVWQPISFARSYDLSVTPPPGNYTSYPDSYTFTAVSGPKLRWSFDGSGANILGNIGNWHGWVYEVDVFEAGNPNQVQPTTPKLLGRSSTWLAAWTPFTGDANGNSYTIYETSTSATGPWTAACGSGVPGESTWRGCAITGLTPGTSYYARVTFVDPDGVVGANPRVYGPVSTMSTASNAVTVNRNVTFVHDTYIQVATLISGDANANSRLQSVEVAPSDTGPWTTKCGPLSQFAPKLCRVHGLTSGNTYYLRVTISDVDGVVGPAQEVIGPITYTGRTNLALGRTVTTNVSGWGCCSNRAQLVDGRIQDPDWPYGFAWCGGTGNWGGCGAGWKNATIDLGSVQMVSQLDWWPHDSQSIPTDWRVEVSADGVTYTEVASVSDNICRDAVNRLNTGYGTPNCRHSASFAPTGARYVRYSFDDPGIFNGLHGWSQEIEVFGP